MFKKECNYLKNNCDILRKQYTMCVCVCKRERGWERARQREAEIDRDREEETGEETLKLMQKGNAPEY